MRTKIHITLILIIMLLLLACKKVSSDHAGPIISNVSTTGKVVVISDCSATSVTITAKVTDASKIINVLLWHRIGSEQPFSSAIMELQEGLYTASIKGKDLQGNGYGAMEFYITAEDGEGNTSKSPIDNSIQFLPCVNN
jgi:hypothetical protein